LITINEVRKRIEDIETCDGEVPLLTEEEADIAVENKLLSWDEIFYYTDAEKYDRLPFIEHKISVIIETPSSQIGDIVNEIREFVETNIIDHYDVNSFYVVED
jgi:hypothetical protein